MNPANAPIMMLAITSDTYDRGQMYDIADSVLSQKLAQIDVPEPWTANVSFGGKDKKILFITSGTSFYSIRMRVKGANEDITVVGLDDLFDGHGRFGGSNRRRSA